MRACEDLVRVVGAARPSQTTKPQLLEWLVIQSLTCTAQIKRMDMEARSLPAEQSRPLQAKVKDFKTDLAKLKDDKQKAVASMPAGDAARAELVSAS